VATVPANAREKLGVTNIHLAMGNIDDNQKKMAQSCRKIVLLPSYRTSPVRIFLLIIINRPCDNDKESYAQHTMLKITNSNCTQICEC